LNIPLKIGRDDEEEENEEEQGSEKEIKPEKLKESRKKILQSADYIIPGHGPMFGVN